MRGGAAGKVRDCSFGFSESPVPGGEWSTPRGWSSRARALPCALGDSGPSPFLRREGVQEPNPAEPDCREQRTETDSERPFH